MRYIFELLRDIIPKGNNMIGRDEGHIKCLLEAKLYYTAEPGSIEVVYNFIVSGADFVYLF
jgi:hypothetical protein